MKTLGQWIELYAVPVERNRCLRGTAALERGRQVHGQMHKARTQLLAYTDCPLPPFLR
jgi:hypothetical protein